MEGRPGEYDSRRGGYARQERRICHDGGFAGGTFGTVGVCAIEVFSIKIFSSEIFSSKSCGGKAAARDCRAVERWKRHRPHGPRGGVRGGGAAGGARGGGAGEATQGFRPRADHVRGAPVAGADRPAMFRLRPVRGLPAPACGLSAPALPQGGARPGRHDAPRRLRPGAIRELGVRALSPALGIPQQGLLSRAVPSGPDRHGVLPCGQPSADSDQDLPRQRRAPERALWDRSEGPALPALRRLRRGTS